MTLCCLRASYAFFVVYRPPNYNQSAFDYATLLIKCLEQHGSNNHINIVVGDFNCPKINWVNNTAPCDYVSQTVLSWAVNHGFTQHVNFATRGQNTLDLVLTDDDLIVNHVAESAPIGLSDHCIVDFVLNVKCCPDIKHLKADDKKIWFDTDFEGFGRHLNSVNWNDFICYNPSAEFGWLAFVNLIWEAVDHFVPSFVKPEQGSRFKPHCCQLRKLITKKRHL